MSNVIPFRGRNDAPITEVAVNAGDLLTLRDHVDASSSEMAFSIKGQQHGTRAKVDKFIPIQGVESTGGSVNHTSASVAFLRREAANDERYNRQHLGEIHSHPQGQPELSGYDKQTIERRRENTNECVYFLLFKKSNGNWAYKAYDNRSRRINVAVTNDRGETRVSGENSAGPACWGPDFWATTRPAANDENYQMAQAA
ncbi:MAG: hypothetical protein WCJ84_01240 [Candidatus Peregrinibacteria bacterium]